MRAALLLSGLALAPTVAPTIGGVDELDALLEAARALAIPALDLDDLGEWRDHLLPSPKEVDWESIPWIPTFAEGVRRADAERRPLLFWAMNGHPLGCT